MSAPSTATPTGRWLRRAWLVPVALLVIIGVVLLAQWVRSMSSVQSFLADYPGQSELPAAAPVGLPAWLGWQHGLNAFFMLFIIRSGLQVRFRRRPPAYWTRENKGLLRTKGQPVRVSIDVWLHIVFDSLWILNGVVFLVLLFVTGQWLRVVPTSWDIIPNAVSAALQYVSLNWPTENGWVNYNALQVLAYFVVIFVAAPLSLITGLRTAPGFASRLRPLDKAFPVPVARKLHFWLMVFFVLFIAVHVTLVLATGALRNLNHMYASRDEVSWIGFAIFVGSLLVMGAAWFALRPVVVRTLAGFTGRVSR